MKKLLVSFSLIISAIAFGVASDKVWRVPSGGSLPSWGQVNLSAANAITGVVPVTNGGTGQTNLTSGNLVVGQGTSAVTTISQLTSKTFLPSLGLQTSSSSGTFNNGGAPADVTNLTLTFTTTGRPVFVGMVSAGSGASSYVGVSSANGAGLSYTHMAVRILRDGSIISDADLAAPGGTSGTGFNGAYPIWTIDSPSSGSHTYKVQAGITAAGYGGSSSVVGMKLIAYEM